MTVATILRHRRRHHFTVVPNPALRDERLSFRARGLLCYLLSLPDGSPVNSTLLASQAPEGRDAVRTAFGELVEAGYGDRRREQQPNGQWITVTEVSDEPGKPTPEKPVSVGQALKSRRTNDEETKANTTRQPENLVVDCDNPDCTNGWVYNPDRDGVHPCPTCRPVQYRDTITAGAPPTTAPPRRDLD